MKSVTHKYAPVNIGPLETSECPPIVELSHSGNLTLNDGTSMIVTCSRENVTVPHVDPLVLVRPFRDEAKPGGRRRAEGQEDLSLPSAPQASNYEIPQAWAEFLDNPSLHWKWYGHFTFKDYPHPEGANKAWMFLIHQLNRHAFGVRYTKDKSKGVIWARGSELQGRGAIHYHALIGNVPDKVNRFDYMERWYGLSGIARIYAYERGKGAEFYMSKSTYAWKRGEIDLSETMRYHIDECVIPTMGL